MDSVDDGTCRAGTSFPKKKKSNELGCYNEYRLRQAEDS
jgi:hypothetical protein